MQCAVCMCAVAVSMCDVCCEHVCCVMCDVCMCARIPFLHWHHHSPLPPSNAGLVGNASQSEPHPLPSHSEYMKTVRSHRSARVQVYKGVWSISNIANQSSAYSGGKAFQSCTGAAVMGFFSSPCIILAASR